jgi:ergothioneine biosynthesis protein EgtB
MAVNARALSTAGSDFPSSPKELAARYEEVRAVTKTLSAPLTPEDCAVQSMPDASPTKWHLGHTSWFFETFVLGAAAPGYQPFDERFGYLFNSYYNAVGDRLARHRRGLLSRPALDEVYRYRAHVDRHLLQCLSGADAELRRRIAPVIVLGLHHEQQHQELILTDVKHLFASNPLRPPYREADAAPAAGKAPPLRWVGFPEEVRRVGHEGGGFAYDNETPRHNVFVGAFRLAARPVTNGEYVAFVDDGGYDRPELWLSDGWNARTAHGWRAPQYWESRGDTWELMTLAGVRPLEGAEPVCHVSFYEADAYARWAGARLPTEAEWEVAAGGCAVAGNLLENGRLQPKAADAAGEGGLAQLFGDVWEWTSSPYTAYPGYRPPAGALGEYNGKFMCNQLVLRGGSCATPQSHLRATYRNFFPPEARWQFSGIRLATDGD